jgi:hypothetical protein
MAGQGREERMGWAVKMAKANGERNTTRRQVAISVFGLWFAVGQRHGLLRLRNSKDGAVEKFEVGKR